jgi:hypothetical protein
MTTEKCEHCGTSRVWHTTEGRFEEYHQASVCRDALKSQLSAAQARIAELEARTNYLEGELYDGLQVQMNAEICDRCEELETQLSSTVSARYLTIRDLRARVAELERERGELTTWIENVHSVVYGPDGHETCDPIYLRTPGGLASCVSRGTLALRRDRDEAADRLEKLERVAEAAEAIGARRSECSVPPGLLAKLDAAVDALTTTSDEET